jgi:hypothetical protein
MGQDKPTHLGLLERASLNHGQTPVRRKQLINTRQPVLSVGDRNKITVKDKIESCAKHAHVKKCEKRKYGLDSRNSVRNESKNLEDAWLIYANKESCLQGDFRESDLWSFVFYIPDYG